MKLLYLGDDNLKSAAAYLSTVLSYLEISFDYCPSNKTVNLKKGDYDLYILSDYPISRLPLIGQRIIKDKVNNGSSLLMIGGWESYYGVNGEYANTIIEEILPVSCLSHDDRINYCQGLIPTIRQKHTSINNLPWEKPPVVCGFNQVKIKKNARCILALQKMKIKNKEISLENKEFPLLVFGEYGQGKTCALTTDLAPHWVGGMVDWGSERIRINSEKGGEVEVGNYYIKFIEQLINSLLKGNKE